MDCIKYENTDIRTLESFNLFGGLACICNGDNHRITLEVE